MSGGLGPEIEGPGDQGPGVRGPGPGVCGPVSLAGWTSISSFVLPWGKSTAMEGSP